MRDPGDWHPTRSRLQHELKSLQRWKCSAAESVQQMSDALQSMRMNYRKQFQYGQELEAAIGQLGYRAQNAASSAVERGQALGAQSSAVAAAAAESLFSTTASAGGIESTATAAAAAGSLEQLLQKASGAAAAGPIQSTAAAATASGGSLAPASGAEQLPEVASLDSKWRAPESPLDPVYAGVASAVMQPPRASMRPWSASTDLQEAIRGLGVPLLGVSDSEESELERWERPSMWPAVDGLYYDDGLATSGWGPVQDPQRHAASSSHPQKAARPRRARSNPAPAGGRTRSGQARVPRTRSGVSAKLLS